MLRKSREGTGIHSMCNAWRLRVWFYNTLHCKWSIWHWYGQGNSLVAPRLCGRSELNHKAVNTRVQKAYTIEHGDYTAKQRIGPKNQWDRTNLSKVPATSQTVRNPSNAGADFHRVNDAITNRPARTAAKDQAIPHPVGNAQHVRAPNFELDHNTRSMLQSRKITCFINLEKLKASGTAVRRHMIFFKTKYLHYWSSGLPGGLGICDTKFFWPFSGLCTLDRVRIP